MNVLLIGGFLGGGKTTTLNKLLRDMDRQGLRVAVIENEISSAGVDQDVMEDSALRVIPLFGGCVCCQLALKFQDAVRMVHDQLHPDWIVVELTGLALMKDMKAMLARIAGLDLQVRAVTIADAARIQALATVCRPVLANQLLHIDAILLNKIDLQPVTDELLAVVRSFNDQAPILPISAIDDTPLWEPLQEAWR